MNLNVDFALYLISDKNENLQHVIQHSKKVRPRTILDSLNGVRCALEIVLPAKADPTHELHYLASQVIIDSNFVEALHVYHKQIKVFINLFDGKHVWQVIRY